jgi:hypothetical protein
MVATAQQSNLENLHKKGQHVADMSHLLQFILMINLEYEFMSPKMSDFFSNFWRAAGELLENVNEQWCFENPHKN